MASVTRCRLLVAALGSGIGSAGLLWGSACTDDSRETLENWSCTHACRPARVHRPSSLSDLERVVASAHEERRGIRCVGSGLSPNGLGFSDGEIVNLEECNHVLAVDPVRMQVTVEAGIQVGELIEELKPHGLTLQNLASIALQQVGGFTQVGAHGTGAQLPPVEEQIVSLKLVTPGKGTLTLSRPQGDSAEERLRGVLFSLAKCGLGCLGVVAEVTLQCVPAHKLTEHTMVLRRDEAVKQRAALLRSHRHVRYMWVPYEDAVVVVYSDEADENERNEDSCADGGDDDDVALAPLRQLLCDIEGEAAAEAAAKSNFAELRDRLLAAGDGVLSAEHVRCVNHAEAAFWRLSAANGSRTEPSHDVLHFECGGQQWVWENALACGTLAEPDDADMRFMGDLLARIERDNIAAPSPIEQRWTCGSTAAMSPVSLPATDLAALEDARQRMASAALHSWVGVIMYMPSRDDIERAAAGFIFCFVPHPPVRTYHHTSILSILYTRSNRVRSATSARAHARTRHTDAGNYESFLLAQ